MCTPACVRSCCMHAHAMACVSICVCNLVRRAYGFCWRIDACNATTRFFAFPCGWIKAAAAERNHPIVWEHWGPLSILSGTSKHTARRRTIRVHGWDGNALQYVLWAEIHEDGFVTKSRVLCLRLHGGLPLI